MARLMCLGLGGGAWAASVPAANRAREAEARVRFRMRISFRQSYSYPGGKGMEAGWAACRGAQADCSLGGRSGARVYDHVHPVRFRSGDLYFDPILPLRKLQIGRGLRGFSLADTVSVWAIDDDLGRGELDVMEGWSFRLDIPIQRYDLFGRTFRAIGSRNHHAIIRP